MDKVDVIATDPQNLVMIITNPDDKGRAIVKHYVLRDTVLYNNETLAILAGALNGRVSGEQEAGEDANSESEPEPEKKAKQA
ncbi:MAG: hypothetical protein HRF49_08640 [bacterium]|jgi:hypothetical protein